MWGSLKGFITALLVWVFRCSMKFCCCFLVLHAHGVINFYDPQGQYLGKNRCMIYYREKNTEDEATKSKNKLWLISKNTNNQLSTQQNPIIPPVNETLFSCIWILSLVLLFFLFLFISSVSKFHGTTVSVGILQQEVWKQVPWKGGYSPTAYNCLSSCFLWSAKYHHISISLNTTIWQ